MNIGTRLFVTIAIPIAILIAAFAILEDSANRARSREEVAREGRMVARAVQIATSNALRDRQLDDVQGLIDQMSGHDAVIAVRLFDSTGALRYAPSDSRGVRLPAPDLIRRMIHRTGFVQDHYTIDGQPVTGWLVPLQDPAGRPLGAVQVLQRESFVEEDAKASSRAIGVFAALLILAIGLTVYAVTRASVASPIDDLVTSVRRIGDGEWAASVPVARRDELGRLATEFNSMRERLAVMRARLTSEQDERRRVESDLRDAERLASLGRFAAGVAHEIATPLNVISGRAESILRRGSAGADAQRGLRIIAEQSGRITRIVRGVLEFARTRELRMVPTDLGRTIGAVVEMVEDRFQSQGVAIETFVAAGIPEVAADPDQIQQVFLNLALNAAEAMPDGGRLRISAAIADRTTPERGPATQHCVAVAFEDTGVGIAPGHLARVFEPFFTTKEVGGGTGLGLAISYGIVKEHGGWIDVASAVGKGTSMTVCLPVEAAAQNGRPRDEAVA